jgi:hypothetical protein
MLRIRSPELSTASRRLVSRKSSSEELGDTALVAAAGVCFELLKNVLPAL